MLKIYFRQSSTKLAQKLRLPGGGRHLKFEELDRSLEFWVRERRAHSQKVTRRIIMQKAQQMFVPTENKEFKVSNNTCK